MKNKLTKVKSNIDWFILLPVLAMLMASVVFVYSASAPIAAIKYGGPAALFTKQVIMVILAIIVMILCSKINYHFWEKLANPIMYIAVGLLIAVLVAGTEYKGGKRWLSLGTLLEFQPVELVKIAIVIFFASMLTKRQKYIKTLEKGFLPFLFWLLAVCALIYMQPNFSNMAMIFVIGMCLIFIGKVNKKYFVITLLIGLCAGSILLMAAPYRANRVLTYLGMNDNVGWQSKQALIALGNGGIFGVGIGQSKQSHSFLPESYADFIFSVIGEEYGFIGLFLIITAFGIILWRGLKVAFKAPDTFGFYLATGIILILAVYFLANAAINLGLMPPTGIPLPFISYGGTAIVIYAGSIGILLNISKQTNYFQIPSKQNINIRKNNE
jgi:cell division protein FtsW